jgi:hypothetical protein
MTIHHHEREQIAVLRRGYVTKYVTTHPRSRTLLKQAIQPILLRVPKILTTSFPEILATCR